MIEEEEEKTRQGDGPAESAELETPAESAPDGGTTGNAESLVRRLHELILKAAGKADATSLEGIPPEQIEIQFGRRLTEADHGRWLSNSQRGGSNWDGTYSKDGLEVQVKFVTGHLTYPLPNIPQVNSIPHLIVLMHYTGPIRSREHLKEAISPRAASRIILPQELARFLAGADISVNQYSLGDHPIGGIVDDKLDFRDYAIALANLVDNPATETPLTLAIHAAWGVGKSSLGKLIEALLKEKPAARPPGAEWQTMAPHRVFWFNAWRHDEADSLGTAFVAELSRNCFRNTGMLNRIINPLPVSMRTKWMSIAARALAALVQISIALALVAGAIWAITAIGVDRVPSWLGLDKDSTQTIVAALASGSVLTAALPLIKWALSMRSSLEQFVSDPKEAAAKGLIGDTRNYLATLVRNSVPEGSRLVIFIDDIERCRGTGGIDLLEAINQLLMQHEADQPNLPIVVIVLGDIDLVALAAGTKYKEIAEYNAFMEPITDLAASATADDLKKAAIYHHGRRHLQKIVQLRFNLIPADRAKVAALSDSTKRAAQEPKTSPLPGAYLLGEFARMLKRLNPLTAVAEGQSLAALWREHRALSNYYQSRPDQSPTRRIVIQMVGAYLWIFLQIALLFVVPGYLATYVAAEAAYPRAKRTPGLLYGSRQLFTLNWGALSIGLAGIYSAIYLAGTYVATAAYPPWVNSEAFPAEMAQPWIATLLLLAVGLSFLWSGFTTLRQRDAQRFARYATGDQSLKPEERESEIYKRIQEAQAHLSVTTDSDYFKTAQAHVLQEISLTPRMLKRSANRIRLMMSVLYQRKLLGEQATGRRDPAADAAPAKPIGVGPDALGKWVAFEERWPDLARMAMKEPELLMAWEIVARGGTAPDAHAAAVQAATDKEGIFAFLKKEPDLSKLVDQLLSLREPQSPPPA
jgi:hypothetical protein